MTRLSAEEISDVDENGDVSTTATTRRTAYDKNPFLNFTVTANKRQMTVSRGTTLKPINSGLDVPEDAEFATTIAQTKLVDEEQFIKVFTSNIASIFDLSSAGIKMFGLLLLEAQKTAICGDMVFMSPAIIAKLAKQKGKTLSASTYHRGINDLIQAQIIAASTKATGWFYINPAIIFNGDRARFVMEYRKPPKKKEINKNQSQLSFYNDDSGE